MDFKPFKYGTVNGDPFEFNRIHSTSAQQHGITFTDTTPNGQLAYRDLCQIIEHEAKINNTNVLIVDPRDKLNTFTQRANVDTHTVRFELLGNPLRIPFPKGFHDPLSIGAQTIQSLLLSIAGQQGVELSYNQQNLLLEMIKQLYIDSDAPQTSVDRVSDTVPTLAEFSRELQSLCRESSQPVFNEFATCLSVISSHGEYGELGMLSGKIQTQQSNIQRYILSQHPEKYAYPSGILYHILLNCIMTEAHDSMENTWVILGDYQFMLEHEISQRAVETAFSFASGANAVYDIVIENFNTNPTAPPLQNWYNQGRYTRYYTTDGTTSFGAVPDHYSDWLTHTPTNGNSHSVLAVSTHNTDPYQLETTPKQNM